jgi:L-cysteine/cystine lyase
MSDQTNAPDAAKLAAIRAELPAVQRHIYLNAGTNGPLTRRGHAALVQHAEAELIEGRIGAAGFKALLAAHEEARTAWAGLLGCEAREIALTHNTTEGINIALLGIDWQPGDELITAVTEHEGGLNPCGLVAHRYGVRVRYTDIGLRGCDPLAALEAALTPRTRAVVLSHVSWATGMILPMRAICDLAHRHGALVICDAAQAAGMVPSQVYELGVDAYACSGQKWLLGPDGTGALFIRGDRFDTIRQTYVGYFASTVRMNHVDAVFTPPDSAVRYEAAAHYPPALLAFAAGVRWIAEEIGWAWVYRRIAALGRACHDALAEIEGVQLYLPRDQVAGLVHFVVAGVQPAEVTARLAAQGIHIRHTPAPALNRVSTGFYTTEDEIARLAAAVRALCPE